MKGDGEMTEAREKREYVSHLRNEIRWLKRRNETLSDEINQLIGRVGSLQQKYSWNARDLKMIEQQLTKEIEEMESAGIKVYPEGYDPDDDWEELC